VFRLDLRRPCHLSDPVRSWRLISLLRGMSDTELCPSHDRYPMMGRHARVAHARDNPSWRSHDRGAIVGVCVSEATHRRPPAPYPRFADMWNAIDAGVRVMNARTRDEDRLDRRDTAA
jgi:hypothetical protein